MVEIIIGLAFATAFYASGFAAGWFRGRSAELAEQSRRLQEDIRRMHHG